MLISNKLHSFRNFSPQIYEFLAVIRQKTSFYRLKIEVSGVKFWPGFIEWSLYQGVNPF